MPNLPELKDSGLSYYYTATTALDRYFRAPEAPNSYIAVQGTLVDLARIYPRLRYPGLAVSDAAVYGEESTLYFRCIDTIKESHPSPYPVMKLLYDPEHDHFLDPCSVYPLLRSRSLKDAGAGDTLQNSGSGNRTFRTDDLLQAAVLMSRYNYDFDPDRAAAVRITEKPPPEYQRIILSDILTGMFPWKGMQFLADCGLLDALWPELSGLDKTNHSKEYHPEGNVWEHSLESFRYRKAPDLTLTLGLLLHDAGKPSAKKSRENAFDGHAEIGARIARGFLRRLEFPESIVSDVVFLVKHHMIPGAMQRLPLYRTEKLMSKEIFPLLLELYRCDLSSTYRGPDGFYRACKIYRNFLRYRKNPFRSSEGKKLARLYIESR